jgi:DNA-directed RNA polymerase II subunit RPB7
VTEVLDIGKGKIREGAGLVTFPIRYMAVVFRPFKGEVLDAVVTTVNKMGFFAEVGPLQVFVSKHLIPNDMEFDSQSNPASYVSQISDEQPMRVTKDSEVRLRIMGTRVDATEIFAIGTIKDEYLGLLQPS